MYTDAFCILELLYGRIGGGLTAYGLGFTWRCRVKACVFTGVLACIFPLDRWVWGVLTRDNSAHIWGYVRFLC